MHNLLHLLCGLPNGANIHNCRPSEVGAGKTLHGRRHGGREHDSLVEEMGGEGEGRRWEGRGREERGGVGEKGREKGGEEERERRREGRGGEGKEGVGDKGYECIYGRAETKAEMRILQVKSCHILHSLRTVQSTHIPSPALASLTCLYRCFVESMFSSSLAGFSASSGHQQEWI